MKNWKPITGALLLFIFGMVTGAALTGIAVKRRAHTFFERGSSAYPAVIVRRLDRELQLTPEQRTKVAAIVNHTREELRELRKKIGPEAVGILREGDQQIRSVLDDKQREKFQDLSERFKRRWNRPE